MDTGHNYLNAPDNHLANSEETTLHSDTHVATRCEPSSHKSPKKRKQKMIYNSSRTVHVDEMIQAILPKVNPWTQEQVKKCYEEWKNKQISIANMLKYIRSIVPSDLLYHQVERIRREKSLAAAKSQSSATVLLQRVENEITEPNNISLTQQMEQNHEHSSHNNSLDVSNSTASIEYSEERAFPSADGKTKRSWTRREHLLFLQGLEQYGKGEWHKIAEKIGTRTASQVRSHSKKYFLRQKKDQNAKKMKTIHDMTMESPEMQQLANELFQQTKETKDSSHLVTNTNKQTTNRKSEPTIEKMPKSFTNQLDGDNLFNERIKQHVHQPISLSVSCVPMHSSNKKESIKKQNNHLVETFSNQQQKITYYMREKRIRKLENSFEDMKNRIASIVWGIQQLQSL